VKMNRKSQRFRPLTAYRVTLSDGSSYATNMAAGVTLEEARAYYIGNWFEQPDERTMLQAVAVEQIKA
jgi:L-fucose isomerase-like protein